MQNSISAQEENTRPKFRISRELDAPQSLVFQAWTVAQHLIHWWGPKGFTLGVAQLDLTPGGTFLYSMHAGDGPKMWGKFVYVEIGSPSILVFINSFADSEGNVVRAPFSETWPLEMENHLTLTDENSKTTLTLEVNPFNATEEEHQTFQNGFTSMDQGFGGTFDNLTQYLSHITTSPENTPLAT